MTPAEVKAITNPAERALQAQAWLKRADAGIAEVRVIRDRAILELRKDASQRQVAEMLNLSPAAVAAIEKRSS